MEPDALRAHLLTLHHELSAAHEVDPRSSQLLGEIMEDIKRLLERAEAARALGTPLAAAAEAGSIHDLPGSGDDDLSLPDRLEQIAVQFELDHPTLAASSRRLVDLLGKVGL